LALASSM